MNPISSCKAIYKDIIGPTLCLGGVSSVYREDREGLKLQMGDLNVMYKD